MLLTFFTGNLLNPKELCESSYSFLQW